LPPHQARARHLENAHLVGSSKSILRSPDNAVIVMPLALEIENGIDNVFERFWARNRAVLGYVTD